jgi:mono/diheme cytochrome c family protein
MRIGAWLVAALLLPASAIGGAMLFVRSGYYDISSTNQHTQPVYLLLEKTMHHSVRLRAADIAVPPLDDAARVSRGAQCYVVHCVQCHGGPGVAQGEIGRSMQPVPGPLVDAPGRWRPQDLYWITAHGIKMSGMPAWRYRLSEDDLWALVAFMDRQLPLLMAAEFRALDQRHRGASCRPEPAAEATASLPPDPERGLVALTQFACNACHLIPGITGSDVHVGPPLQGFARRGLIAGAVVNETENLVRWIRDPQAIDPLTAMPDMDVGERDARDIAAYLQTLD